MALSKLTLSIESEYIEKAKSYAAEQNMSVSKLFKDFIQEVSDKKERNDALLEKFKDTKISPDILSLVGILKGKYPEGMNYKDMKYEYLKEKYGL